MASKQSSISPRQPSIYAWQSSIYSWPFRRRKRKAWIAVASSRRAPSGSTRRVANHDSNPALFAQASP
eukprot:13524654-Heterocapsa_arctica.AAC.1